MSNTPSSRSDQRPAEIGAVQAGGLHDILTSWGPLTLLSIAVTYALAGLLAPSGAMPASVTLAPPYRPTPAFPAAAAPLLTTHLVGRSPSRTPAGRGAVRAFGLLISIPVAAAATAWLFG
jgi:hypothetical protein